MKKICRVLNIRKHKLVVFVDAYTNSGKIEQVMFDKGVFSKKPLKCGDCFAIDGALTTNLKGNQIFKADKYLWVSPCQTWETGNHIQPKDKGYLKYAQINARNGGKQINIYKLKQEFIKRLGTLLEKEKFENVKCSVLEKERTGSAIPPFQTKGASGEDMFYLRITPENQLKQTSAILLKSVYTIDNVFFNKNPDAKHYPEMCTLEFVALNYTNQKILRFITKVSQLMGSLGKKYGFESELMGVPEIVDYNNLEKLGIKYQRRIPEFKNTILINTPVRNPLVKSNARGQRTEIRWYVNGAFTAHGYQDETDYSKIKEALQQQKIDNNLENVDEMSYVKWGLPKSTSFGLGVDALICRYLNLEHMALVCNPLGINYNFHENNLNKNNVQTNKGFFITFEGIDGAGKTSHADALATYLIGRGYKVFKTSDLKATPYALKVRENIVKEKESGSFSPLKQCLDAMKARADTVEKVFKPALDDGTIIICDRFLDSSLVFHGYGEGNNAVCMQFDDIKQKYLGDFQPDLTIMLDVEEDVALSRVSERGTPDVYEKQGIEYFRTTRQAFSNIAERNKSRCVIVSNMGNFELVSSKIKGIVNKYLKNNLHQINTILPQNSMER